MSHARIEELSDSDYDSDPDEQDIGEIAGFAPGHAAAAPGSAGRPVANDSLISPGDIPSTLSIAPPRPKGGPRDPGLNDKAVRDWQCLYPIYFDASRSRAQGRRVSRSQAVANPLARAIVEACARLGLHVAFEPGKTHPKDWANPGRVRVQLKTGGSTPGVDGKHHLYLLVALHLKANPTNPRDPLLLKIPGMPEQKEPLPPPAVPRGWKMNAILPLHSPAVTGGGVSENLFKDMMAEMQGQQGASQPAVEAGPSKAKKDKRKGKT